MRILRDAFPDAVTLRVVNGDEVLGDRELSPGCGFCSMRETAILMETVARHPGDWLEFGSHVGWSAAHIAAAGGKWCCVTACDPEYKGEGASRYYHRAFENWTRAKVEHLIYPTGFTSAEYAAFPSDGNKFSGVFIDGDHDDPNPTADAAMAHVLLETGGVIVLHDAHSDVILRAVRWLEKQGYRCTVHRDCANGIAVCEAP